MMLVVFVMLIAAALLMMRHVMKRIRSLIGMMDEVKGGNLTVNEREQRPDEFSYLYTSFNSMIKSLNDMINEVYHLELMHKDVQLALLHSQVNPHFLYNIFNNMHWLIKLTRYSDLDTLVNAVSIFYSRSLNDGRYLISIQNTVEKLKSYVQIQQIRFTDRFTFSLDIDDELLDVEILNHMLQPLLENAIIHGIEPCNGMYEISITGKMYEKDKILFRVADTGAGIVPERLEMIQESLEQEEMREGCFALQNIHSRIRMFYGEQYGLSIESTPGEGTAVSVLIPHPQIMKRT
jgi:two-component system sensor histidine kinase YesM